MAFSVVVAADPSPLASLHARHVPPGMRLRCASPAGRLDPDNRSTTPFAGPKPVRFECDPRKAAINLRKHGVAFAEAVTVFADPLALYLQDRDDPDRAVLVGSSSQHPHHLHGLRRIHGRRRPHHQRPPCHRPRTADL